MKDRQIINYTGKFDGVSYAFREWRCAASIEEINKIEELWQEQLNKRRGKLW